MSQEALALLAALYFSVASNATFFRVVGETGAFAHPGGNGLKLGLFVAITALNTLLLLVLFNRWTTRMVLTVLLLLNACAGYFMSRYTVYLDPGMLANILQTDGKESRELLTSTFAGDFLLYGVLPATFPWLIGLRRYPWRQAIPRRLAALLLALSCAAAALMSTYQPLASLMRNHHQVRYLVTPGNYLVSLASSLRSASGGGPRIAVGTQARVVGRPLAAKPRLLVLVVGETVRAQNWGLNGYARQTTPNLASIQGVVNFSDVTACGSSTEVSVPCMFSPYGRQHYDAAKIKRSEGLLHVLEHAGIRTLWRDNQTGCKGTCTGLPFESFEHANVAGACNTEGCLDQAMLHGLAETVERTPGDMVVVLHQLGNHGPAYYKRYPPQLARFGPACRENDLSRCSRDQIVNAYDNAVLNTDLFLANAIHLLAGLGDRDTALLYVSDHGESLGENGLFLHGIPYPIAPDSQLKVPMVTWLSDGLAASRGVDAHCLQQQARRPASHDNLFHSVLGLLQVRTPEYDPRLDLFAPCSARAATASGQTR